MPSLKFVSLQKRAKIAALHIKISVGIIKTFTKEKGKDKTLSLLTICMCNATTNQPIPRSFIHK